MRTSRLIHWATRTISYATAALFMLAMVSIAVLAQDLGQLTGRITDPQDKVVPSATVTIKSVATGSERTQTTDDQGTYVVTALQPGLYDVTVKSGAFAENTQRVEISVGGKSTLDFTLSTQSVAATVDVVAGAGGVEVNTTDQQLSDVVTNEQIRELPTLTRNPYDLVGIAGNVSGEQAGQGRGTGFAINGQRSASTSILLDGAENTDNFVATVGQLVPLDSVQEFRVITGNFSAEYGRASGGIVNVATVAGNNEFHGTGYGFNRISRLASNGFDNNARGIKRQVFTRNQFGYSIGGPIVKNKLFFFSNTEWIKVRSGGQDVAFVPTPQLLAASSATTRNFFANYATSAPIGRVLTVSDVIAFYGAPTFVATPNSPGGNAFVALPGNTPAFGEVTFSSPQDVGGGTPQDDRQMVIRIDANLSDKTQFYGRYAQQDQVTAPGTNANSPYTGFATNLFNFNQNLVLNLNHSLSPNLVSQSKFGFNRLNGGQPLGDQPPGPTLYTGGIGTLSGVFLSFPGYLPTSPGSAIPFSGAQNVYQFNQDMSLNSGRHNWRFGGQIIHMRDNKTFGAYLNSVQTLGNTNAESLSNLVTGNLTSFAVAIDPGGRFPTVAPGLTTVPLPVGPPAFSRSNRYIEWAVYVNDSIRYTPRLTLNLGLRYEYYGVPHNAQAPGLDANFYYGSGSNLWERIRNGRFQTAPDSAVGGLWRKDKNNFAPRIGFAWDINGDGKTSLRGGYGMAYERNFGNVTFNAMFNPPNYAVVALSADSQTTGGVTQGDVDTLPIFAANLGPFAGTGPPRTLTAVSARHIDENIVTAHAHFWSLSFERQLARSTVASLEYSASAGRQLYSLTDINRTGCGLVFLGSSTPAALAAGTTTRCNGVATSINTRGNLGYSNYRGITASLESNDFRNMGLTFTGRYTYSVARDNTSSTFTDGLSFINLGLLDTFDPGLDYGKADFHVKHRFSSSFNYEFPFKKNSGSAAARHTLGGWSLNGLFAMRSGYPFTIFDSTFRNTVSARLTPVAPVVLNTSNPPSTGQPNEFQIANLSNQTTPTPRNPISLNYNFGPFPENMSQRNAFTGPGFWDVTAGLYKRIHLTERVNLQLRMEVFNLFNHANLFIDRASAQRTGRTVNAFRDGRRNVQLAAKFIF